MHTVRAARRRGKSVAGQLAKGLCERATQVIVGVSVTTRKARAAPTQQLRDGRYGCSLSQQLLSNPLVGNTPIGGGEIVVESAVAAARPGRCRRPLGRSSMRGPSIRRRAALAAIR
jgi:hypothetical protein